MSLTIILLSVASIWSITNLSNPKTAMFITSLFASVLTKESTLYTGLAIVGVMTAISLIWYTFVVLVFSSRRFRTGYTRMQNWLEGIAGIIFIGFGAKLIFQSK